MKDATSSPPPEDRALSSEPAVQPRQFVLNCVASRNTESDWTPDDAWDFRSTDTQRTKEQQPEALPEHVDLRSNWWKIRDQGDSGACVGFAAADGVLRWHYVKQGLIEETDLPSPRFIWMANKETDTYTRYPTTFLETAGTSTKLALGVAQKFGCVLEELLPMTGLLSPLRPSVFFAIAARHRINSYYNLGKDLNRWKSWLATNGPILTRLDVDDTWMNATATEGRLQSYSAATKRGGHAVCLVGYTDDYFIVRNSWGETWGDAGFAYARNEYAALAFTEAYGVVM